MKVGSESMLLRAPQTWPWQDLPVGGFSVGFKADPPAEKFARSRQEPPAKGKPWVLDLLVLGASNSRVQKLTESQCRGS